MPYHNFFGRDDDHGSPGRYGNVGGSPGRYGFNGRRDDPQTSSKYSGGIGKGVRFFHGPIRFSFFGRPIFISTGRQVAFIVGFVALLVMIISTFATFGGLKYTKQELAELQNLYTQTVAESNKCLNVIQNAKSDSGEANGYYLTTGYFYNSLASRDFGRYDLDNCLIYKYGNGEYYIRFVFFDKNDDEKFCDTFAMYTNRGDINNRYLNCELTGFEDMKEMQVAYSVKNGQIECAVNTDYDGTVNFERDYYTNRIESTKASIKTYKTSAGILIGIIVVIVALVVLGVVKVFKNSKKKADLERQKQEAETMEAQAKADMAKQELDEKNRYCTYCGAKLPDGATKCPNCGSTKFDIKN